MCVLSPNLRFTGAYRREQTYPISIYKYIYIYIFMYTPSPIWTLVLGPWVGGIYVHIPSCPVDSALFNQLFLGGKFRFRCNLNQPKQDADSLFTMEIHRAVELLTLDLRPFARSLSRRLSGGRRWSWWASRAHSPPPDLPNKCLAFWQSKLSLRRKHICLYHSNLLHICVGVYIYIYIYIYIYTCIAMC